MASELRIDLLRHGEVAGGRKLRGARTDDPLTERGWRQLQQATGQSGPWDRVVSSPLVRCRAFAESLTGADLRVDPRLSEYDFGDWDGCPLDALWAEQGDALAAFLSDPGLVTPPNGEAASEFCTRVRAAWDDLVGSPDAGEHILVIGHGGVLRQWLAGALGAPMAAHASIEWPHGALSRLRVYLDPPHPRSVSLAFHARVAEGLEPRMNTDEHG
ncbi:MAG: histidine phosphatase family protein [Halofilum sp. (in: g-proteobacteria)]